jgi:hypothetical protein
MAQDVVEEPGLLVHVGAAGAPLSSQPPLKNEITETSAMTPQRCLMPASAPAE